MLDIILQILSVLGIILLVLLSIIVVLLLLVLFFPVTYKILSKKTADSFSLSARAGWLFGLLRVRYAYPEPGKLAIKILWFTLHDTEATERKKDYPENTGKEPDENNGKKRAKKEDKEKVKYNKKRHKENKEKNKVKNKDKTHYEYIQNHSAGGRPENQNIVSTEESKTFSDAADGQIPSQEPSEGYKESPNWISGKIEKIKFTILNTYDKINKIWQNISYYVNLLQDDETHLLLSHVLKRLGRIIKHLRPRKLRANILFGTGAPDTTGYAFGVYCMFSPILGPGVMVTPDFERAVFEGDFMATGHITSVALLWQFLRVILDRKLWRFWRRLKSGREAEDTSKTHMEGEGTKRKSAGGKRRLKRKRKMKAQRK